jgi:hypothetical protein
VAQGDEERYRAVQSGTERYRAVQSGTERYRAVQSGTEQSNRVVQRGTGRYRAVQSGTERYRAVQSGTERYRTVKREGVGTGGPGTLQQSDPQAGLAGSGESHLTSTGLADCMSLWCCGRALQKSQKSPLLVWDLTKPPLV